MRKVIVSSFAVDPENALDPNLQALFHLVDAFAQDMKAKLRKKHDEGWRGWDLMSKIELLEVVRVQMTKGPDPVDLANLAAFLWNIYGEG
jgi:hypothetical protein